MDMDRLRRYELYVILQPELDPEQLEAQIDRINGYLTSKNGDIIEVARKGKRRLVYPIRKFNQGIDIIYQVYLPSAQLATLERQLNLNEDVIRYLVVRRDDLANSEKVMAAQKEIRATPSLPEVQPKERTDQQPMEAETRFATQPDFPDISWD